MFDLFTDRAFVREGEAEHAVEEVLGTETRARKQESDTAEGDCTADRGTPGVHTATDART